MEEEKATTQKIEEDKELLVQNISPNSSGPKLKIIIFSILGLIFAASLVFIGYQFGQRRDRSRPGPKSNCQVCKGPLDISCPGGLTCTLPQGSDQGVCLPVAKPGQSYTNNQINQECGTNFPEVQPTPVETPDAKWKTYTNEKYEYEVKYPESFTVVNKDNIPGFIPVCDPQLTSGCLSYTGDQYKNSDFEGAGLSINIIKDAGSEVECSRRVLNTQFPIELNQIKKVNGINFYYGEESGAATGHQSESHIYRTFHSGLCYEINQTISTCSCKANSPENSNIQEFTQEDKNKNFETLDQILLTFEFKKTISIVTPTPEKPATPEIVFKYNFPDGWKTLSRQDIYSVGYDPEVWFGDCFPEKSTTCQFLLKTYDSFNFLLFVIPYDGGSRRVTIQNQFNTGFDKFTEIEIDGKRGLMTTTRPTHPGEDTKLIVGIPRGKNMVIITTNVLWPLGTHVSGLDQNYVYKVLGTLKIE